MSNILTNYDVINVRASSGGGVCLEVDDAVEVVDVTLSEEEAWKLVVAISSELLKARPDK